MEHHAHPLGRAVTADALVGGQGEPLEQFRGDVPARLVERLDSVQGRVITVALGQSFEHVQGMADVGLVRVPLAHAEDAAVVKAVLAARGGVQVEHHPQPELGGPREHLVDDGQPADHEGVAGRAVAAVVGVVRAEQPVAHRQAHRVDAGAGQPGEVVAGDEGLPVVMQPPGGLIKAQFGAVRGLVRGGQAREQARGDPFFEQQPAAEVDAAQPVAAGGQGGSGHGGLLAGLQGQLARVQGSTVGQVGDGEQGRLGQLFADQAEHLRLVLRVQGVEGLLQEDPLRPVE